MEVGFSCQRCYERKVKCDRGKPRCSHCQRQNVPCEPSEAAQKKRKRDAEAEIYQVESAAGGRCQAQSPLLLERLERYETLLQKLKDEVSSLKRQTPPMTSATLSFKTQEQEPPVQAQDEFEDLQVFLDNAEQAEGSAGLPVGKQAFSYIGRRGGHGQMLLKWLDKIFPEDDAAALLYMPPADMAVPQMNSEDIDKLWTAYCDNVDDISKLVHLPTVAEKIKQAKKQHESSEEDSLTPADHALLFCIWYAAATSVSPAATMTMFKRSQQDLLSELRAGVKYWLHKSSLFKTENFQVLQAYVIFLTCCHSHVDPRTNGSFTAMAMRLAQRMSLHRESSMPTDQQGKPSFAMERELRRRVWWELQILEGRSCEKCGLGSSVLLRERSMPLPSVKENAAEAGPIPALAETTTPSPGMLCFMIRCELAKFLQDLRASQGGEIGWTEFSTAQWSLAHKLTLIRDFQRRLEFEYLVHCDPSNTLEQYTMKLSELMLARMRLSAYTSEESLQARKQRKGSHAGVAPSSSYVDAQDEPQTLRNQMLLLGLQIIEAFTFLLRDPKFTKYHWSLRSVMPFQPMVHLMRLLQKHTTGPLVDRIWTCLEKNADLWKGPPSIQGKNIVPLFCFPLLQAWSARKAALPPDEQYDPFWIQKFKKSIVDCNQHNYRMQLLQQQEEEQRLKNTSQEQQQQHSSKTQSGPQGTELNTIILPPPSSATAALSESDDVDWEQWIQDFLYNTVPSSHVTPSYDWQQYGLDQQPFRD
ncbi:unnamed protein product [Sympodiomycopsis kandeliae]